MADTLFPTRRLLWLAWLRLLALLGGAILTALAAWRLPDLPGGTLTLVVGLVLAFNLGVLAFLRTPRAAQLDERTQARLIGGQIAVDLVGLTVLLHFAGGAENPFFPCYAFPVVLAAALLPRRAAYGFAGLASILYVGILCAEWAGWLPHHTLSNLHDPGLYQRGEFLVAQATALVLTCFMACEATATLVGALHRRARALAESQGDAEARAAELRQLNEQLRTAAEQGQHKGEHLDAAYRELQQAYMRLEARSRHMSELNEQLRVANAECKSRREELADVNNRLQEAYTRLEVRTDHMRGLNEQLRLANEDCRSKRDELAHVNAQLVQANAKLRDLDDFRSRFTLLVTHELRAPVAAIQSYLRLILDGYVPEIKVRETLEKAERRAMEQLALISDLLELGRIQSVNARGQVQPIHVEKVLAEQLDVMAARASERSIEVHADVAADLPPVLANPDQIKSLWVNLISNAIKYNRDGGRVDVTLQQEGDRLVASVSDTGIGIPPEAMARLFSEFFRADNAKALSRMGTGLGLSIVKEIIERAGGQITAESVLNEGTTFRFWLPVAGDGAA